jgi:hypothetical protein
MSNPKYPKKPPKKGSWKEAEDRWDKRKGKKPRWRNGLK